MSEFSFDAVDVDKLTPVKGRKTMINEFMEVVKSYKGTNKAIPLEQLEAHLKVKVPTIRSYARKKDIKYKLRSSDGKMYIFFE